MALNWSRFRNESSGSGKNGWEGELRTEENNVSLFGSEELLGGEKGDYSKSQPQLEAFWSSSEFPPKLYTIVRPGATCDV